jgi:hypothetical protein
MVRRLIHISILLLLVFGSEALGFSHQVDPLLDPDGSSKACEDDNLNKALESWIPEFSCLAPNGASPLYDQGFLSSIFRPPRLIF